MLKSRPIVSSPRRAPAAATACVAATMIASITGVAILSSTDPAASAFQPGVAVEQPGVAVETFTLPEMQRPPLTAELVANPTTTFVADTPDEQMYIDVIQGEGLELSNDEARIAVLLLRIEVERGGFIAGRQDAIRGQVRAALPRLDERQDEVVVDCVVKAGSMIVAGQTGH